MARRRDYFAAACSEVGSIEEDKWADMVLVDRNVFDIPVEQIHEAQIVKTLFKGRVVYEAE